MVKRIEAQALLSRFPAGVPGGELLPCTPGGCVAKAPAVTQPANPFRQNFLCFL